MNEDFSAQGTAGGIREVYKVPNGVRKANHLFFFSPGTGKREERHETERIGIIQKRFSIP